MEICEHTGKIIYRSAKRARQHRDFLHRTQLREYQCEHCGKWHLGHKGKPIGLLFALVARDRRRTAMARSLSSAGN